MDKNNMVTVAGISDRRFSLPSLRIADGTLEALKWLGLLLMTGDHVNKYLFNETMPLLFDAGRAVMPIFVFGLAFNLARPGTLARGVYQRTMGRLAVFGALATPAFIALGGLLAGWWPLNILFIRRTAGGSCQVLAWRVGENLAVFGFYQSLTDSIILNEYHDSA